MQKLGQLAEADPKLFVETTCSEVQHDDPEYTAPERLERLRDPSLATKLSLSFFFQAEDGIRHLYVTGVQTSALPISDRRSALPRSGCRTGRARRGAGSRRA